MAGEYNDTYFALNRKLNEFVLLGERTLRDAGYDAYAQNTDRVVVDESHRSLIPRKTAAVRAGVCSSMPCSRDHESNVEHQYAARRDRRR